MRTLAFTHFAFILILFLSPVHAAANKWTSIGPDGGAFWDLAFPPKDKSVVLACSAQIYRSSDSGSHWEPVLAGDACLAIRYHPVDSSNIVAATNRGLFRSRDSGRTWQYLSRGFEFGNDSFDLEFHSSNPAILYAAGVDSSSKGHFLKSTDGGSTWKEKTKGLNPRQVYSQVEVDPKNGNHIVLLAKTGIYDSKNAGEDWQFIKRAAPAFSSAFLRMDREDAKTMYVGYFFNEGDKLYKTSNGGATWTKLFPSGLDLDIDPRNRNHILLADGSVIWESFDGGKSAIRLKSNPLNLDDSGFRLCRFDPRRAGAIIANLYPTGSLRSFDSGRNWTVTSKGFNQLTSQSLASAGATQKMLLAVAGQTLISSAPGSSEWRIVSNKKIFEGGLSVHSRNPNLVVAGRSGGIAISSNGGLSWQLKDVRFEQATTPNRVIWDTRDLKTLYYAPQPVIIDYDSIYPGLMKSTDSGSTWLEYGVFGETSVTAIAVHPTNPSVVLVGTGNGGIFRSMDAASTWRQSTRSRCTSQAAIRSISFDPLDPKFVYASGEGNSGCSNLYKSSDSGLTWKAIDSGSLDLTFDSIVADPRHAGVVYVTGQALYASADHGNSWSLADMKGLSRAFEILPSTWNPETFFSQSLGSYFSYSRSPSNGPLVLQLYPNPVMVGETLSIKGTNFGTSQGDVFLGQRRLPIISWSSNEITLKVPAEAQTASVRIQSATKGSNSSELIVLSQSLHPISGPPAGGTRVALLVRNPQVLNYELPIVLFGKTAASNLTIARLPFRNDVSAFTLILCTTPPGSGAVPVSLIDSEAVTQLGAFSYE